MSLFDDIAHAIGHTVDTLAQDVGAGVTELESIVTGLAGDGVDVFMAAEHFGLSAVEFLRSMVTLVRGNPHEVLLQYVVGPVKPVHTQVDTLSTQWGQQAALHEETASMINAHLSDLYQASGSHSYSGQAADALWTTHQDYQQHFTALVSHAQTQQTRHATLAGHTGDFLSQAPGKVYSLSLPMAALGVMSLGPVFGGPSVGGPSVWPAPWPAPAPAPWPAPGHTTLPSSGHSIWPVVDAPPRERPAPSPEVGHKPSSTNPILWLIMKIIAAIAAFLAFLASIYNALKNAFDNHQNQQHNTTVQQPKHKPTVTPPVQGAQNSAPLNLTDAQKRLLNDVRSRLGNFPASDAEIADLIRAGYLDPNAIAAMIRGGNSAVFNNADVAKLTNELTDAQQLKFIAIVQQYQKTHPGLTSHQIYNYLRYTQMLAQADQLQQDITNSPINNATYHDAIQRLLMRLDSQVLAPMNTQTDPFAITDNQLGQDGGGWKSYLVGIEGEWGVIEYYYRESLVNPNIQLVNFSVPYANPQNGETDIIINENGVEKWIEVKNYQSIKMRTAKWQKLRDQVIGAINEGSKNIIIDLPQGAPSDITRNLIKLGQDRGVLVTVQSTPGIPYEPPIPPDWGKVLPIPRP